MIIFSPRLLGILHACVRTCTLAVAPWALVVGCGGTPGLRVIQFGALCVHVALVEKRELAWRALSRSSASFFVSCWRCDRVKHKRFCICEWASKRHHHSCSCPIYLSKWLWWNTIPGYDHLRCTSCTFYPCKWKGRRTPRHKHCLHKSGFYQSASSASLFSHWDLFRSNLRLAKFSPYSNLCGIYHNYCPHSGAHTHSLACRWSHNLRARTS